MNTSSGFNESVSLDSYCLSSPDIASFFRGVHLDRRARRAHQAPLAPPGQTELMWVSTQVYLAHILPQRQSLCWGAGQSHAAMQYRGFTIGGRCKWKHSHTKRALFPAERGVFEKGPSPESSVCVAVMWYIRVIPRVNYKQAGPMCQKGKVLMETTTMK